MNKHSLKYKFYTHMLEGNISRKQHDMLLEIGFLDKIKSFLGGTAEVGGDLAKLFKDKVNQKQFGVAKNNITKAVEDLKQIAAKAGVGDDAVNEFLKGVLDAAGVDPASIASATPQSSGKDNQSDSPTAGVRIDPAKPEQAVPTLAAATAQAAGQDPVKAKEQATEKKVTPEKATEFLAKAVAKSAGVDAKATSAVIKALMSTGHLVAESRRLNVTDIKNAVSELNLINENKQAFNRWSLLAGIRKTTLVENLLIEAASAADEIANDLKDKKIKDKDTLIAALKNYLNDDAAKKSILDVKDTLKTSFKDAGGDEKDFDQVMDDFEKKGKQDPEGDKKAEEAKKKFGAAFDDVKKQVGDAADDAIIGKVLAALDELEAIQVK